MITSIDDTPRQTEPGANPNAMLARLARKYSFAATGPWRLIDGADGAGGNGADGCLKLVPWWLCPGAELDRASVPLFPWRSERRFQELRAIVAQRTIDPVLMCRFACMTDGRPLDLSAILFREFDLLEWLAGRAMVSVYASVNGATANVVVRLAGGVLGSVEVAATLPPGARLEDRHELIARRGVACDRTVDTQVAQSSVYVTTAAGVDRYTDTDDELFGLDEQQVALVRAGWDALRHPEQHAAWRQRHARLTRLVALALESDRKQQCLAVEESLAAEGGVR
ncbi:MAG: hypothetical protein U1E05_11035 [Patescibacteria group bacterium]|nr:hypothetical protein [Patescibacteria group bacterium]